MSRNDKNSSLRQKQKDNIRTLVENSSVSKVRSAGRVVKYGAASFKRNVWLSIAATLVMTITLLILLITIGASLVLSATADAMREKIDITLYFRPGTDIETLNEIAEIIKGDDNIRSIEVSDSANEFQIYLEENKDNADLMDVLQDPTMSEIMLNTMQSVMRIKVYDPDQLETLKSLVQHSEFIQANIDPEKEQSYDENRDAIATISSWANLAKNGGIILGAIFLVISILMIFNTIRMAIFSRREEIYMMRLVGADLGFIRGPFLIEAEISGIISGILATTIVVVGYQFLAPNLSGYGIDISTVSQLLDSNMLVAVYGIIILVGMVIGTISARLAMQKYLK